MAWDIGKSPFPGMDPYLEPLWGDAHAAICVYSTNALRPALPADVIARLDHREYREFDASDLESPRLRKLFEIRPHDEPARQGFVQLIDLKRDHHVITVIEFLSPYMRGSSFTREAYRKVQFDRLNKGINVVEIDLICSGPPIHKAEIETAGLRGLFYIWVTEAADRKRHIYPIRLQDRLPKFRVPLGPSYEPAILDLQPLIEKVYEHGSYGFDIHYSKPPDPPLAPADAKWAREWLATKLSGNAE